MKFKITVETLFQFIPEDLDKHVPKTSYEVEVSGSNTVADFRSKLYEMIDLKNSEYVAEFHRESYFDGNKMECDERIEDGATVYAVMSRCIKKFKITVMTFFQFVPKDLDKYDPKPSFEVEVSGSNTVADFHSKLTEMIDLRNSECVAEFYRDGFNVGNKMECDERIEDGATVYAVIVTKKKLKQVVDETVHKDVKNKFDKFFKKPKSSKK